MALLDGVARKVSQTLIQKFGRPVTANVTRSDGYDPSTGYGDTVVNSRTVTGIIGRWNAGEIGAGSEIRTTDVKFVMAALGNTEPTTNDTFTIDSVEYEVVEIRPMWSGEQVAYYWIALRS